MFTGPWTRAACMPPLPQNRWTARRPGPVPPAWFRILQEAEEASSEVSPVKLHAAPGPRDRSRRGAIEQPTSVFCSPCRFARTTGRSPNSANTCRQAPQGVVGGVVSVTTATAISSLAPAATAGADGVAFGAHAEPIRGVLYVAPRVHRAITVEDGRAHHEVRVGGMGPPANSLGRRHETVDHRFRKLLHKATLHPTPGGLSASTASSYRRSCSSKTNSTSVPKDGWCRPRNASFRPTTGNSRSMRVAAPRSGPGCCAPNSMSGRSGIGSWSGCCRRNSGACCRTTTRKAARPPAAMPTIVPRMSAAQPVGGRFRWCPSALKSAEKNRTSSAGRDSAEPTGSDSALGTASRHPERGPKPPSACSTPRHPASADRYLRSWSAERAAVRPRGRGCCRGPAAG